MTYSKVAYPNSPNLRLHTDSGKYTTHKLECIRKAYASVEMESGHFELEYVIN